MDEKDFLQGYEIKPWDFNPRTYKILAASALINMISILVVGQSNLTQSACDSPFVERICQVLDTVYVTSKILTTDAGYVVKEYEESRIKDSDVVWVDQTNVEAKMQYPAGYFQIANRDELALLETDAQLGFPNDPIAPIPPPVPIAPPVTPRRQGSLADNQILPKRRDNVVDGDLPDDPLGNIGGDPASGKNSSAGNDPKKNDDAIDKNTARDSDSLPEVQINKKPLYDFADAVNEKVIAKKVDLSRSFYVVMNAVITEDGKLDINKSSWIVDKEQGDPEMILVAKDAVEKVGDSGWLVYLSNEGIKNVRIVFFQDDERLAANIVAMMPTENRARMVASGYRTLKSIALLSHNNGSKTLKEDEVTLLNAAEILSEKNQLRINFDLKKEVAQQIIDTRLKEYQADKEKKRLEKPAPKQPNGKLEKSNARERSVK